MIKQYKGDVIYQGTYTTDAYDRRITPIDLRSSGTIFSSSSAVR